MRLLSQIGQRYLSPMPQGAPVRISERLLDRYLTTLPGSPEALAVLAEVSATHQNGEWRTVREPERPKKEKCRRRGYDDLTDMERRKIAKMYSEHFTLDQIAQATQCSINTINRTLQSDGVPRRKIPRGTKGRQTERAVGRSIVRSEEVE
ncbi:MAG: hypothetical protein ACPHJ3_04785 [Rubripirellula sp.]